VEVAAQKVLAIRAEFLECGDTSPLSDGETCLPVPKRGHARALQTKTTTLADLYDPLATPPALQQAHEALDRAVDKCYRPEHFTTERQRVEFLFALYEKLATPLVAIAKPKRVRKPS
jgi:hypothetical protein